MDPKRILFTGGSGLLGTAMKKLFPEASFPTSSEFNIANFAQIEAYVKSRSFDQVFHAAALTSLPKINEDPIAAIDVNMLGTANVVKLCAKFDMKLLYVSTDYVFNGKQGSYKEDDPVLPINKYAWSKLGGECAAQLYDRSLIIRTTFGPDEFPYPKAIVDQWTSRQGVTETARMLAELFACKDVYGVVHVGGPRKTVFEYAKEISPDKEIGELSLDNLEFHVPRDTSLDCSRYLSLMDKYRDAE